MQKGNVMDDIKKIQERTGTHLLMAGIISAFSILLIFITLVMSWELWTIPLIFIGIFMIWFLHIGKFVSDKLYEYISIFFIVVEFFYYGIHSECLFDIPFIIVILFFLLTLLDRKGFLYLIFAMYFLMILYHFFFLHTIHFNMKIQEFMRFSFGLFGTFATAILSSIMISRSKQERKEMREMAEQLKEAKQKNADFLSNVSHELRTPINMVTGISEVALGKELPPQIWESIQSIQLAGKRLARQINDILDYTELVGNTLVVTEENYIPSSIVNDMLAMSMMQNLDCDLEIVFDLDPKIPSVLIGDAEKISRVLRILIQNAIKFTEEGGIYVYIGFREESYGINLDITIKDTGIGMTDSQLSKIYDDFYQADSRKSRYVGGLGLGIPIARGLLYAMNGFIHYESIENKGTQVHISIPQKVADDTPGFMISNPKQFCVICYFKQERYHRSEVRQYYDDMILHMTEGLDIEAYRAYHFEDLEILINKYKVTHLFLTQEEYQENVSYYEELARNLCIVLIAKREFSLSKESRLILLYKPFFALPIVNLFNHVTHGRDLGESVLEDRLFSCKGVKALIIDDEEMNLVVARGILNSYGILVDTCLSGAEAVERCLVVSYDIIFLDHMMPGMDGVETLKHIRALKDGVYETLPIIALTANAISGAREMFKGEGFTEFVPKPIERPVLERVLRHVLPEQSIQFSIEKEQKSQESNGIMTAQKEVRQEEIKQKKQENIGQKETKQKKIKQEEVTQELKSLGSPFEYLEQIGIDTEIGLDYCSRSEDFYLEMLQMYYMQSMEKRKEIVSFFEQKDWENYAIKVHALKSTSLTIGAKELSEKAKALELAGKSGDIVYIEKNHKEMLQCYDSICNGIAGSTHLE